MTVGTIPRFFTINDAAKVAQVSEWSIRAEVKAGRLRAKRIGRCVRILDEDLAAWAREQGGEA